jgi:RNA polymerase sigma factor (sigma-70 family)
MPRPPPSAEQLARRYEPLARTLAWRAARRYGLSFDLAYSDALLGLTLAIARCTPGRPLAPYARQAIVGEILHGVRDRVGQRTAHERGDALVTTIPLEDPLWPGAETLEERYPVQLSTPDPAPRVTESLTLWAAVAQLPRREQVMIALSYRADLTQTEIAQRMGTNQMMVSRVLTRAYAHLAVLLGTEEVLK